MKKVLKRTILFVSLVFMSITTAFANNTIGDVPSAPERPKIIDYGSTWCELEWEQPDDDGGYPITSYDVEYCANDGVWVPCGNVVSPTFSWSKVRFQVINLKTGVLYTFRVRAKNRVGNSEPSNESASIRLVGLGA